MSSCNHEHRTNVSSKSGPARMATTQEALRKEFSRRFRALRGALRATLVEHNALALPIGESAEIGAASPRTQAAEDVQEARDFDFRTRTRAEAFREWWSDAVERGLLEPLDDEGAIGDGRHYTAPHVEQGYRRGLRWSNARAREFGVTIDEADIAVVIQRPVHQNTLRTLFNRTYGNLESVAQEAEDDVARILANGVADGQGPREIARTLNDEVRDLQHTRARMVARSEVMNSFVRSSANRYQQLGVRYVNLATLNPCPQCIRIRENGPYRVSVLAGAVPVHPNCACAIVPARADQDAPSGDFTFN